MRRARLTEQQRRVLRALRDGWSLTRQDFPGGFSDWHLWRFDGRAFLISTRTCESVLGRGLIAFPERRGDRYWYGLTPAGRAALKGDKP